MDWKYVLTSFEGRINRGKFWAVVLLMFVVSLVAGLIDSLIGVNLVGDTLQGQKFGFLSAIVAIVSIYIWLAVYAKRWHDRDKSGWWTLIILIPVIGALWMLIECGFLSGTRGPNRFGPDPLAGR